jgi:hypothetical protein
LTVNAGRKERAVNRLVWAGFALGVVVATAPVWQRMVLGYNPTLAEVLSIALCTTRLAP